MNDQEIFEQLRRVGFSVVVCLAWMGNWKEEANLEACRLQGDFQPDRWPSKEYARKVDNRLVSDEWFYRDGKGWGLPQFTFWSRKKGFLELCRKKGVSISDRETQIEYAIYELNNEPQYAKLKEFLKTCGDNQLYEAVERICREFERPAYNNVNVRYQYALDVKNQLQAKATEQIDNGIERFWPPRMICNGMNGPDVSVLQSLLTAHGYVVAVNGVFSDSTEKAARKFQTDRGLDVDGIVGPKTWAELTKM